MERAERRQQGAAKENQKPKLFKKTHRIFKRTQKVMKGCFDESHAKQLAQEQFLEEAKSPRNQTETIGIEPKVFSNKSAKYNSDQDNSSKSHPSKDGASKDSPENLQKSSPSSEASKGNALLEAHQSSFVIREAEGLVEPEEYSQPLLQTGNSATLELGPAALHQVDDYFSRLAGGSADQSPYVENKALQNVSSTLGKDDPDSPVSNLFEREDESEEEEKQVNFKSTVLSKTIDSIIDNRLPEGNAKGPRHSQSSTSKLNSTQVEQEFPSPSDSMLQYQKAIGTVAETPGFYPVNDDENSDPLFMDESNEASQGSDERDRALVPVAPQLGKGESELTPIDEKGDDESSCLSYMRPNEKTAESAFRPRAIVPNGALKQVAALRPSTSSFESKRKVSKLESLFRPVLPTLSADDANSCGSFDPWEIKVTESAPGAVESRDYRSLALRRSLVSPQSFQSNTRRLSDNPSPSLMSIDSQVDASPAMTKNMVSNQAIYNAEFLFSSLNHKPLLQRKASGDGSLFSINTRGARSRLSARSSAKAVEINVKNPARDTLVLMDDQSYSSKGSNRHVRFSLLDAVSACASLSRTESIDLPTVESTVSDISDKLARSSLTSQRKNEESKTSPEQQAKSACVSFSQPESADESPIHQGQWCYKKDGVTPFKRSGDLKAQTNSPYLRFQSARNKFETSGSVEVPEIQNIVSDLTEDTGSYRGRPSEESAKTMPETIQEQAVLSDTPATSSTSATSHTQIHWSYSVKDGNISHVTPAFGKDAKLATKSPYIRFENAKNKFGAIPAVASTAPSSRANVVPTQKKDVPFKSPRSSRVKQAMKKARPVKSGGSVASKIEDLNKRVVEAKLDRKNHRWTKSNPRKYAVIDSNAVRTRAIVNYKTSVVGLKRMNYMSAAKFNTIPIEDDSSVESGEDTIEQSSAGHRTSTAFSRFSVASRTEEHATQVEDDDESKLTVDDMSKLSATSIGTARQEQTYSALGAVTRVSEGTYTTSSSGFTNIRKQVFGSSASVSSNGASTTMSSILGKENYLQFRTGTKTVKPTEQVRVVEMTKMQNTPAQKWRSLAAAAKERDSQKKPTSSGGRKGLSIRDLNAQPVGFYEC